jgi:hypothetical protein
VRGDRRDTMATWPRVTAGYAVAVLLYVVATIQAWAMLALVGTAFVVALSVSVAARS